MKKITYLKLFETFYLFNHNNKTVSEYELQPHGFLYSVTRYSDLDFEKHLYFIQRNSGTSAITQNDFADFATAINAMQANANSYDPITTFEQHHKCLIEKFGLSFPKQIFT